MTNHNGTNSKQMYNSEELFYQVVLNEFCNMGQVKLSTPISIKECVLVAIAIEEAKGNLPDDLKSAEEIAEVRLDYTILFAFNILNTLCIK